MTADPLGGVWHYAIDLAAGLARCGHAIALATFGAPLTDAQRRQARAIPGLTLCESRFRLEWMREPWDDVAAAGRWLLDLAGRFRPDLVHLNDYAHAGLPWGVPVLVVGHSCVLSWWQAVRGAPAPAEWDRYRAVVRAGLAAADMVVAPSRALLAELDRHYGPLGAARVIHNGRDPALFRPLAAEPLVLSAGRLWDEAKNVAAVAACAAALPWPVCLAGETHHPDGGAPPGLPGVRLLGPLAAEELRLWYGRAAIYALPARYEPFGLSVLEAALSGCALVLGDIPSLRELWDRAALFVPPGDHAALAAALATLTADPARRRHLARRALLRAARYPLAATVAAYRDLYAQLLAERRVRQAERG